MSEDSLEERRKALIAAARERGSAMGYGHEEKLSIDQLAEALYEGTPHLQNLAEKLARQHGQGCTALSFYKMMGDDVENFWRGLAKQMIDHAREWRPNKGSGCVLSDEETARLRDLPRVPKVDP